MHEYLSNTIEIALIRYQTQYVSATKCMCHN